MRASLALTDIASDFPADLCSDRRDLLQSGSGVG